jgi:hypothetical protein
MIRHRWLWCFAKERLHIGTPVVRPPEMDVAFGCVAAMTAPVVSVVVLGGPSEGRECLGTPDRVMHSFV